MKMIEIILVVVMIGILATIVTPRLADMVDAVMLDREVKRLSSEIRRLQSMSRTASYDVSTFNGVISPPKDISLKVFQSTNSYAFFQSDKQISDSHYLSNGIKITEIPKSLSNILYISFNRATDSTGISDHITFTSRRGISRKIIFDSVGRWRIE